MKSKTVIEFEQWVGEQGNDWMLYDLRFEDGEYWADHDNENGDAKTNAHMVIYALRAWEAQQETLDKLESDINDLESKQ